MVICAFLQMEELHRSMKWCKHCPSRESVSRFCVFRCHPQPGEQAGKVIPTSHEKPIGIVATIGGFLIKVNQEKSVVRDVIAAAKTHMGLEAGSKPELLIVLAELDDPEAIIVCGYKDVEYIETALMAQRLGRRPFLVVEKPEPVDLIIQTAKARHSTPHRCSGPAGFFRHRPVAKLIGRSGKVWLGCPPKSFPWSRTWNRPACSIVCSCCIFIGSQISAIRTFKNAIRSGSSRVELVRLGAPDGIFDIGGGLGVDYDGSRSDQEMSVNYNIDEYAEDVVSIIARITDEANIPIHPSLPRPVAPWWRITRCW